eukprot:1966811-Rhodomonas_salina.2
MCGTDIASGATCYAMSGTDIAYQGNAWLSVHVSQKRRAGTLPISSFGFPMQCPAMPCAELPQGVHYWLVLATRRAIVLRPRYATRGTEFRYAATRGREMARVYASRSCGRGGRVDERGASRVKEGGLPIWPFGAVENGTKDTSGSGLGRCAPLARSAKSNAKARGLVQTVLRLCVNVFDCGVRFSACFAVPRTAVAYGPT